MRVEPRLAAPFSVSSLCAFPVRALLSRVRSLKDPPLAETVVVHSDLPGSGAAGAALGGRITAALQGDRPDALILFASPRYDYEELLAALNSACAPRCLVGCSSAGEFTTDVARESSACAIALRAPEFHFTCGIGKGLSEDRARAAREIVSSFDGVDGHNYVYHSALVLTDALAGHADELVEHLTLATAGIYQLIGGGAGDDAAFQRTHVFHGARAYPDAAVALEILSNKPLGIGVHHGWSPGSPGMRVTEAQGKRLISLNAQPAIQAFEGHARSTGQRLDPDNPLPFFLHNVLGIDTGVGHKLRVPLAVDNDGAVLCAAEVPVGAIVHIMTAARSSPADAATKAVAAALHQLSGHRPGGALFFDCVASRLRLGREFGFELSALQQALGGAPYAGCNTYGQIARAEGQFSGFHNCTAVVCVFPE